MNEIQSAVLPYLMTIIGFLIVVVLNSIRGEIKELKTTVRALESDLRGGVSDLDRRVARIEARCETRHCE